MKLCPGCILIENNTHDLYTIMNFKNQETLTLMNNDTKETKKENMTVAVDNYTLLTPAGYIGVNTVDLGDNIQDVMVSLYRPSDLQETPSLPYAICRQMVVDFMYQQIDPNTELTGISVSKETCPANVDYTVFLTCNKVNAGQMVAVYIDYTLDYILSFIKVKEFDNVLEINYMDYAQRQADKFGGQFVYNNIMSKNLSGGYCRTLELLLKSNNFMHDFYRAFNIFNFDFVGLEERANGPLTPEETEVLSTMICRNIRATIIIKYDYDVDLKSISATHVLCTDNNGSIYIIGYIEDTARPYEVPVEAVETEEGIMKLNSIMQKAGKNDENIRRAYDHIQLSKMKYE